MEYKKLHTNYEEQVSLLEERGMIIDGRADAVENLKNINYYRLGIYWRNFESDHESHKFLHGTNLNDVIDLYIFDRKLRLLMFDALERIEVSVRTQWTYWLSKDYGTHAQLNKDIHNAQIHPKKGIPIWNVNIKTLENEIRRSNEQFLKNYISKYDEKMPPLWIVGEIMSFGTLSKWVRSLDAQNVQENISNHYGITYSVLRSWLRHLTIVRNNCAHHARLWNQDFRHARTQLPESNPNIPEGSFNYDQNEKSLLFNTISIILYLLDCIAVGHSWRERFKELLQQHSLLLSGKYAQVSLKQMGFPDDWESRSIWR